MHLWPCLTYLCVLILLFILSPCLLTCFFVALMHYKWTAHPLLTLYCSPWFSLVTMFVTDTFLFFCTVYIRHKTSPPCPFGALFAVFCASPLAPTSVRAHPNRSVRICTHPHHVLSNTQKHHVRGNFPDHSDEIQTCTTINAPCLPCFCVSRAPCALTHPYTLIYTHLHLFVAVCTPHFHVYMYNLIQKQYRNNMFSKKITIVSSSYHLNFWKYM